ncbi:hypothetical protein CR513_04948, partial [Mucuna pruriens]
MHLHGPVWICRYKPYFLYHRFVHIPTGLPSKPEEEKVGGGEEKGVKYPNWLSNMVMIKKPSGKCRMCTNYTNLHKACPKDPYPLPNIDALVDGASGYGLLIFMDAYFGYNQIRMHPSDGSKIVFIMDKGNFCYRRLMDRIFKDHIGNQLEVYVDDMVVKSKAKKRHAES